MAPLDLLTYRSEMSAILLLLTVAAADPLVTVVRPDGTSVFIDEPAWALLPEETATAIDKDKTTHTFRGPTLTALLAAAGVRLGEKLAGAALAQVVLVEARDGYRVAFGIGEVDRATSGRLMLLARSMDGEKLLAPKAPIQLIIPGDERQSRWVRQVTMIRVLNLPAL